MVVLETSFGDIMIELDHENTPKTAENFLNYIAEGFYEGTIFHRVIKGFMIQGGGLGEDLASKPGDSAIENEAENAAPNKRGSVAMARTSDPHSATSQFFINVADNDGLNFKDKTPDGWGYCVFGKVVEGMDVVDRIRNVPTTSRAGHQDVPEESIFMEKAHIEEKVES